MWKPFLNIKPTITSHITIYNVLLKTIADLLANHVDTCREVTEGLAMIVGKYEIDSILGTAAILAILVFVIIAALVHLRKCKRGGKSFK